MKKNVRTILTGFVAVALLAGLSSCSNGSALEEETLLPATDAVYSGDEITFTATENSVSSQDVNLIIKYDRSDVGAQEQIYFVDADLEVTLNDSKVSMPSTIKFELDEYSSLDKNYKTQNGAETRTNMQKEYKVKLGLNKKINVGDVVKVQLKAAKVGGEGAEKVKFDGIVISLIDSNAAANYYNELCPNSKEYQSLISSKDGKGLNETDAEETVTYETFTVPVNKTIADASIVGLLLQTDNDGSQDADGLKIEIKDFEMSVKVGDADAITVKEDSIILEPNQYASPAYAKTDKRFRLGLTGEIAQGTNIVLQVKKATITNEAKKDAIIFALQEDGENYEILAADEYIWKKPFEVVEE